MTISKKENIKTAICLIVIVACILAAGQLEVGHL
jgi:hypothetical protein